MITATTSLRFRTNDDDDERWIPETDDLYGPGLKIPLQSHCLGITRLDDTSPFVVGSQCSSSVCS